MTRGPRPAFSMLEWPAALLAAVGFWHVVTHAGGRDPGATRWGLLALVPLLLVSRPARRLRRAEVLLAVLPALGSVLVWAGAPMGRVAPDRITVWAYAGLSYVAVRAFAARPTRRRVVVAVLLLVLAREVWLGLVAWAGGRKPTLAVIGTFYWHNQFGVFCVALVLLALSVCVLTRRWGSLAAAGAGVLGTAGVVLSTSRASMGLLVVLSVVLAAIALRQYGARRALRVVVVGGAGFLLSSALTSGAVFGTEGGSGALGATQARASEDQSVGTNAHYRLDYWSAGARVALEHPLLGAGPGGFRSQGNEFLPIGMQGSPYVHNDYLQSAAEGGLALALPVVAAAAGLTWRSGATVVLATRRRRQDEAAPDPVAPDGAAPDGAAPDPVALDPALDPVAVHLALDPAASRAGRDPVALGAALGALALLAHLGLDFDGAYPALLALIGVLGALLPPRAPSRRGRGVLVLVALTAVAGWWGAHVAEGQAARIQSVSAVDDAGFVAAAATAVRDDDHHDPALSVRLLSRSLGPTLTSPLPLPPDLLRAALDRSRPMAEVDAQVELLRDSALALQGDTAAQQRAADLVESQHVRRPFLVVRYADLLVALGHPDTARQLLESTIAELGSRPGYPLSLDELHKALDRARAAATT